MELHRARQPRILDGVKVTGTHMEARGVRANRITYWDNEPAALFGCPSDFLNWANARHVQLALVYGHHLPHNNAPGVFSALLV